MEVEFDEVLRNRKPQLEGCSNLFGRSARVSMCFLRKHHEQRGRCVVMATRQELLSQMRTILGDRECATCGKTEFTGADGVVVCTGCYKRHDAIPGKCICRKQSARRNSA